MPWYINDHSLMRGRDSLWHLIGITHADPGQPADERELTHATSPSLTEGPWTRHPPALVVDEAAGERVLWAPYLLAVDGVYHMFYSAGGKPEAFQMKHATSPDLWTWTRDPAPLFMDGLGARDPFVLRIGAQWIMYYTATSEPDRSSQFVVAYRTSDDLVHWSERAIAYRDPQGGDVGGNTESPFVVAREEGYYLFLSVRGDYDTSEVFFSHDPLHFEPESVLASFPAHAPEIVTDCDGSMWMTSCGWERGGVSIARLSWQCD
jgi:arabinan endo-1,5-alpha-L-arabinosidase